MSAPGAALPPSQGDANRHLSAVARLVDFVMRLLRSSGGGEGGAPRWRKLYFSAVFGVFDQGIVSLSNLGAGLLVIRTSTKDAYGLYSIGYTLVMLGIGISGGLFSGQAVVAYYDKPPELRARYIAAMLMGQMIPAVPIGLVVSLLMYLAIALHWLDQDVGRVLIIAVLVAPAAMMHDYLRNYFYIDTVRRAAMVSAVHCVCWLSLSAACHWLGIASFQATLGCYGIAAVIASAVSLRLARLPLLSSLNLVAESVRDAWHHGKWAVLGVVIGSVQNQSQVYLLGVMSGPAQVANVNATRLLFGPLTMLLGGVNAIILPRLVELRSASNFAMSMRLTYRSILIIFPIVLAYAVSLYFGIDFLSDHVFRRRFDDMHLLIGAWAASFALTTFSSAFASQMIAAKRFRALMMLNLATALVVVAIDLVLIPRLAAFGSMIGLVGGQLGFSLMLYRQVAAWTRRDKARIDAVS